MQRIIEKKLSQKKWPAKKLVKSSNTDYGTFFINSHENINLKKESFIKMLSCAFLSRCYEIEASRNNL